MLKEWARGGAPHGAVVATDFQRAGRGRRGRTWDAQAGQAILASVLLRRGLGPAAELGIWSLLWALAVAEAAEAMAGVRVGVKWPNDVEVDGAKLAGILVEASFLHGAPEFLVVGMGVNVLQESVPLDVERPRTSLRLLSGKSVSRSSLLAEILWRGERWGDRLRVEGPKAVVAAFEERSASWLGRPVAVQVGSRRLAGRAVGLDPRGFLILEGPAGREALPVGEVSLRRGEVGEA